MAGRSLPPGRHTTFNLFATTRLGGRYGGNDISDVMYANPLRLNHFLDIVQVHALRPIITFIFSIIII